MVEIGRLAPSFSLPDQDGRAVRLADLRGRWVVLYFYPKDDTPGCTVEACEFTAALPEFRHLDAVVLGCSADGAAAHTRFIAKHRLGITLLTDADRAVMKAYRAFGKKMMYGKQVEGVIRSTVLIAPDGKIAHHWAAVRAAGHAEQVRAKIAELTGAAAPVVRAAKRAKPAAKKPAKKPAPKAARRIETAGKPAGDRSASRTRKPARRSS
ncbi:MAG: peroxiredoxin [Planctomycetes bacterium]|nr:peroxiredoxin [Planctomycetota bacterium]